VTNQEKEILERFGKRLRALREERKIPLTTLEAECGVSRQFLTRVENGTSNPSVLVVHKIAQAFDMKLSQLMEF
jgi:transcriptional regulator with XRE-family HTH domain